MIGSLRRGLFSHRLPATTGRRLMSDESKKEMVRLYIFNVQKFKIQKSSLYYKDV